MESDVILQPAAGPGSRPRRSLTHAELLSLVDYDRASGAFTDKSGRRIEHRMARGYRGVCIKGVRYAAHQLAWFHVFGEWPSHGTDHADLDRTNNAISNIRPATKSQNGCNRGAPSNSKTGLKGASFDKFSGRYVARIKVGAHQLNVGRSDTPEEAHVAYLAAAHKYFGEFARG